MKLICFVAIFLLYQTEVSVNCKNIKCRQSLGQWEKFLNGTCPNRTNWDPHSGCCTSLYKKVSKQLDEIQGDQPGNCEYPPRWDLSCPNGTAFYAAKKCCILCLQCEPGYKYGVPCDVPCSACPGNYYSNRPDHNDKCFPCIQCDDLNRLYAQDCTPKSPSTCGACIEGYRALNESQIYKDQPCVKNDISTPTITDGTTDLTTVSKPRFVENASEDTKETILPMLNLILIIIGFFCMHAIVVYLYKKRNIKNKENISNEVEENHMNEMTGKDGKGERNAIADVADPAKELLSQHERFPGLHDGRNC